MKPITIFEHSVVTPNLFEAEKQVLKKLNDSLGGRLCDLGWRQTKTRGYVGVVHLGNRVLQILPKMHRYGQATAESEREATANLLFLLSYTRKLPIHETEVARLTEQRAPLAEFLYLIFARRLWEAVSREFLRGYVTVEARQPTLKGRWLVAQQLRRPDGWRQDLFDVSYDEFSEDNPPNQLLKAAVDRLSRTATLSETQSHLARLRAAFADVTDITPEVRQFAAADVWMQRHRRRVGEGHLYRPLLHMARMFLVGTGPQPSAGSTETFAFVFDMGQLFEEFIAEFIRRELRDVWQARVWCLHAQRATRSLLCDETAKPRFWLRPDVRFQTSDGQTALILDTKYKVLDSADAKSGISEADACQMFAYKHRYECKRVVLLYPQAAETINRDFSADADSLPWLEVRTVDLRRELMREKRRLRMELAKVLLPPE